MRTAADDKVGFLIPPWLTVVGKSGLWAMLAIALIWQILIQRRGEYAEILRVLNARTELFLNLDNDMRGMQTRMDNAEREMRGFAARRESHDEAMIQLLLRLCIQGSDTMADRQACLTAANGMPK